MIADISYTRCFIAQWLAWGRRGERFISRAAEAQYANLKTLLWDRKHHGVVPHWCDLAEYTAAVRLLRTVARTLRAEGSAA